MKKVVAVLFVFVLMLSGTAMANGGNYLFMQGEDGIYVCGYDGIDTVLRLPDNFKNQPVVGIAEGAFKANRNIIEVYIPDSYRIIGVEAFADCSSLRDVYLGGGVELIDERAFRGCADLLSVSIVQNDFYEDPTAFDGDKAPYNGANINYFRENNNGEDYEWLYIAACDMMSRGRFEEARDVFLSLYGYELSADYYFYCCGRIYEQRGDVDAALAVYALIPDLNDCSARLLYYGGAPEVPTFFSGSEYSNYYTEYFGDNGSYAFWLDTADNAIIGGADEPTSIIVTDEGEDASDDYVSSTEIGSMLDNSQEDPEQVNEETPVEIQAEEPEEIPEEEPEEIPEEEPVEMPSEEPVEINPNLLSYHDFAGVMPYSYDDHSSSDGYFAIYYFLEDIQLVYDYAALFESQGWVSMEESDADGWQYIYLMNEESGAYFMIGYSEPEGMLAFMYESGLPYGFNPANGL